MFKVTNIYTNTHPEYLINFINPDLFLLVKLVNVAAVRVNEEETKAHNLDQHLLLLGSEVHLVLEHVHRDVHYFACTKYTIVIKALSRQH